MTRQRARRVDARARAATPKGGARFDPAGIEPKTPSFGRLLAPLLLIVVLIAELTLLRERIVRDVDVLRQAARPAPTAEPAAGVPAPPVPLLAPASTAAIADVDLRALGRCDPGGPCQVRVLIQPAGATSVHWAFRILDRCGGMTWEAPGGTAQVTPGGRGVAVVNTVALPPARALAVIAVAAEHGVTPTPDPAAIPELAASRPLRVPTPGTC